MFDVKKPKLSSVSRRLEYSMFGILKCEIIVVYNIPSKTSDISRNIKAIPCSHVSVDQPVHAFLLAHKKLRYRPLQKFAEPK